MDMTDFPDFEDMLQTRHPATQLAMRRFEYGHLPSGPLRTTSVFVCSLAMEMVTKLKDGPDLTDGLRKLWEAKNCFVFQALLDKDASGQAEGEEGSRGC